MAAFKLNLRTPWTIISVILLLVVDECKGQSSSGINIVALIAALSIIGVLICLSMPICIICLIIALCCTCNKYRKAKKPSELDAEETMQENKPSVHNLPLPPIPREDATMQGSGAYETLSLRDNKVYGINDQAMQGNDAYGINSLSITLKANQAYDSKVSTDQQDRIRNNAVHISQTSIATTSPFMTKDTAMQGDEGYSVNEPKPTNESTDKTEEDYLKLLSDEETIPTQSATLTPATDDHQEGLGDGQLVEKSEYYNYYDYI